MQNAPRALIAGLGLIGGSIGMALRARGWKVAYLDPNVELEDARRAKAADERVESIDATADIFILATPVDVAIKLLGTGHGTPGTSVCSVMQPFKRDRFVAGHPLAGSHERGLGAARADLFGDQVWFLERHDALVEKIVRDCGARLEIVDPKEHDDAVALTSHLPQLLSTALAAHLDQEGIDPRFAGSGLRTLLRLAASDASVWMSVLESNRENVARHAAGVEQIVREILQGDASAFERAQRFWSRLK